MDWIAMLAFACARIDCDPFEPGERPWTALEAYEITQDHECSSFSYLGNEGSERLWVRRIAVGPQVYDADGSGFCAPALLHDVTDKPDTNRCTAMVRWTMHQWLAVEDAGPEDKEPRERYWNDLFHEARMVCAIEGVELTGSLDEMRAFSAMFQVLPPCGSHQPTASPPAWRGMGQC